MVPPYVLLKKKKDSPHREGLLGYIDNNMDWEHWAIYMLSILRTLHHKIANLSQNRHPMEASVMQNGPMSLGKVILSPMVVIGYLTAIK